MMPPRGAYGAASTAARYRDAELLTASPGQLVVLLYDKILLTLRRARVACEVGRIEERCDLLVKAGEMVTELRVCLDHANGGDISGQLDALYAFMLRELTDANRRQDVARIDVVLRIAGELRDAFATVVATQGGALPAARTA
jgi:flagellar protein FliS